MFQMWEWSYKKTYLSHWCVELARYIQADHTGRDLAVNKWEESYFSKKNRIGKKLNMQENFQEKMANSIEKWKENKKV